MLEGYLRRKRVSSSQNSGQEDATLKTCLNVISLARHEDCWVRIITEVDSGTPVQEVLEMAGGWWSEYCEY